MLVGETLGGALGEASDEAPGEAPGDTPGEAPGDSWRSFEEDPGEIGGEAWGEMERLSLIVKGSIRYWVIACTFFGRPGVFSNVGFEVLRNIHAAF